MRALILQVFDQSWSSIAEQLPTIQDKQITYLQISPVQKHCQHTKPWYRLYQPCSYDIGNSLGSKDELHQLINACNNLNINVIVDVVLHHTCGCPICSKSKVDAIMWIGNRSITAFKSWMGNPTNYERFNMLDWGPRNEKCKKVFKKQLNFLQELIDMGVKGFRIDAAKHIYPEHLFELILSLERVPQNFLSYTEILDGDPRVCQEYLRDDVLLQVTDFSRTFSLQHTFSINGNISEYLSSNQDKVNNYKSIVLADCHDSILGNSYKFGNERDGLLSICMLLAKGEGIPLIYDHFSDNNNVKGAIKFFHKMSGEYYHTDTSFNEQNLGIIYRGSSGIAIFNKSDQWITKNLTLKHGMKRGEYIEQNYQFKICFNDDGTIYYWGNNKNIVDIGPRDALFFVHTSLF